MSGVNRLINSSNTLKGNSQEKLKEELMKGNESAMLDEEQGMDGEKAEKNAK